MNGLKIAFSMIVILSGMNTYAQDSATDSATDSITGTTSALDAAVATPPQARTADEIAVRNKSPQENCKGTAQNAVRECQNPSGQGFKQAMALATAVPGLAMGFMSGGDPGKMAAMCQMSAMANALNGILNQVMGDGCGEGSSACQVVCDESIQTLDSQLRAELSKPDNAQNRNQITLLQRDIEDAQKTGQKCVDDVTKIQQASNQQQQSGQQPGQDMAQCNAMLDESGGEDEPVDCVLNPGDPQCTTLGKTDGTGIGYDSSPTNIPTADSTGLDLPLDPTRDEDFWNNLKNKTSGGGGGSNGGGAGLAGLGSGGGSGNGSSQKTGGGGRKGSASFLGGSSGSGGGGSGSYGSGGSDMGSKLASLNKKKKDLNMLTKKKLGGRGIASSEFGLASDDIWTRLYLRTNTRCTKQLVECSANKSLSPYGASTSTKAR